MKYSKSREERSARLKALAKSIEEDLKNRTAEDLKKEKELSDAWSVVDADGLDKNA